jgi:hypothetical protein
VDSGSFFYALTLLLTAIGGAVALVVVRARAQLVVQSAAPPSPPAQSEVVALRAEWETYRKQLDAYLEAISDHEEVLERKRRRTTSERQRAEEARNGAEPADPRSQLRARARQAMPGLL